jgi:hypothetical protein
MSVVESIKAQLKGIVGKISQRDLIYIVLILLFLAIVFRKTRLGLISVVLSFILVLLMLV